MIAPHPDDESLPCGGLIRTLTSAGVPVQVIAVTDGENAYSDGVPIRLERQCEQERALKMLGVSAERITRLRLPDSGLESVAHQLSQMLRPLVTEQTHVVAPWVHDFHPDHEVCGRAAKELAAASGATLTYYLFWTFHRAEPSLLATEPVVSLHLSRDQQVAKAGAVACHHSQLHHASGHPILPDHLLWPARMPLEAYIRP